MADTLPGLSLYSSFPVPWQPAWYQRFVGGGGGGDVGEKEEGVEKLMHEVNWKV